MSDVFVANDQVADVQVKSQRQLYVFGKSGGETTVYASNASGDIVWSATVRVTRGQSTTAVRVGRGTSALLESEREGLDEAAKTVPSAAATLVF
jgi:Flp pilus assembly secretin CpaC